MGGHVVVPTRINGSKELDLILDTGMSAPIVMLNHRELQEELALRGGDSALVGGAGGEEPRSARMFRGVRLSLGSLDLENQTLVVMGDEREHSKWTQAGVLGKSIFDRFAVEIDFDRSSLTVHETSASDTVEAEGLPLTFKLGIPVVDALVETEGGGAIPARLVVDLGARQTLTLHPDAGKGIQVPDRAISTIIGRGIQGDVRGKIGRIRALRLGAHRIENVVAAFTERETGVTCGPYGLEAEGNLGVEILRRFRVVIDYPHARLVLTPGSRFGMPFEYNMAGLSLEQESDGSYLVREVLPESPGAEVGIRKADRIVSIDGREASEIPHGDGMDLFRQEGRSVRLGLERDRERFERAVTLRRLI